MRRVSLALLLIVGLLSPSHGLAKSKPVEAAAGAAVEPPRMILIIRHAEKPEEDEKSEHLSQKGQDRAEALARVIEKRFAHPDFIFATHKSKNSSRPIETVTPLAKALKEPIDDKYADEEFEKLARKVLTSERYSNKVVLICWHHGKMPDLARAFGVTNAPDKWDGKVFDRVWQITFKDGKPKLADLPQKALPGDAEE